jgi:Na+/melibiose symporter-like transporter
MSAAPPARLPRRTKFAYSLGAIALGVRDTGFNTFLLIFYNQTLGLSAALAGLALALTLAADAVADPLIGIASDGWRSRLGRRHPFMYAAAVPAAIAFGLLWLPPAGMGQAGLFAWLLAGSIAARFLVSLFEAPFAALVAELTPDYDERTRLLTWAFAMGWFGGLTLAVSAYALLLRPTAADPTGLMNRGGFAAYGIVGSAIMLTMMLASALGTQGAASRTAPPVSRPPLRQALRDGLAGQSGLALLGAVVLLAAATGFGNSLYNYVQVFIFGLATPQIAILSLAPFASAALVMAFTGVIAKGRDKRALAIGVALVAVVGQPLPAVLRLAGLFPANGSQALMPILTLHSAFETAVWMVFQILSSSMAADLVEAQQRRTGRQVAGSIFAVRTFGGKAVSGLGVLLSGLALTAVGFPAAGAAGHASAAAVRGIAMEYAGVYIVLGLASAACLLGYRITRAYHAANLAAVGALASEAT